MDLKEARKKYMVGFRERKGKTNEIIISKLKRINDFIYYYFLFSS